VPSTKTPTTKKSAAKTAVKKTAVKAAKKAVARKPAAKAVPSTASATTESGIPPSWLTAARAADDKKATALRVIDLREITTFADFFLICSGSNPKQLQAIANEIETALKVQGERPTSVEGFNNAEWVLMDYGDLVIHIFSEQARAYYDLDRLWRDGKEVKFQL